jgi:hypothetical protein
MIDLINRFFRLLYPPEVPARFSSHFSETDSVARLRDVAQRNAVVLRQASVGPVTTQVHLRCRLLLGYPPRWVFVGTFQESDGRVALDGRFATSSYDRAVTTFTLLFSLLWTAGTTSSMLQSLVEGNRQDLGMPWVLFPFAGFAMFAAEFGFRWLRSRKEVSFMSAVIEKALSGPAADLPIKRTR